MSRQLKLSREVFTCLCDHCTSEKMTAIRDSFATKTVPQAAHASALQLIAAADTSSRYDIACGAMESIPVHDLQEVQKLANIWRERLACYPWWPELAGMVSSTFEQRLFRVANMYARQLHALFGDPVDEDPTHPLLLVSPVLGGGRGGNQDGNKGKVH